MPNGEQIIVLLLGAGGATFVWTLVRSYLAIRGAAETREAVAVKNLERWRDHSDYRAKMLEQKLEHQTDLTEYYRFRSATLEYQMTSEGLEVPPPPPKPPANMEPIPPPGPDVGEA
jgi:hypothetical protein